MKYRLANFCDRVCKEAYENFISVQCKEQVESNTFFALWEEMRRLHHRCFYCSQKLPKNRTRTIG